jgi:hypothetical protein
MQRWSRCFPVFIKLQRVESGMAKVDYTSLTHTQVYTCPSKGLSRKGQGLKCTLNADLESPRLQKPEFRGSVVKPAYKKGCFEKIRLREGLQLLGFFKHHFFRHSSISGV